MNLKNKATLKLGICIGLLCLSLTGFKPFDGSTHAEAKAIEDTKMTSRITIKKFVQLEKKFDARLGVYAIDTGTNKTIAYRPNERFAYASTYKVLAAAAVLKKNSIEKLNEVIHYSKDDLVTYSPITEKHVDTGMSLKEISEAAIRYSDNTAGNILLQQLGGPKGFEKSLKQIGDHVTKANRFETDLNSAVPGDIRDTSTAKALATDLKAFTVDNTLTKRTILTDWMRGNATGDELIRAGAPIGWEVGDKSGAGSYGTRNDIAIVWPPNRAPIILAILSNRFTKDAHYDNALIAEAAKVVLNDLKS
ncbi:class A beta-lactamase [Bacillus inaquosorum]|uniref:class A beta-lactamase n=1 Tax=Bacillus inaquosorum TaxID=483913 RepID=UPI00227E9066|nr:class A beta-lactamase [Bacillus inaquosorum]MCY7943726.1 class A beta-lactamase [Bacillus inaquosorum]MCY7952035.1 class A beta-lactamase [Bacillus inaquosorum]MCY7985630.1 class A beta-lactamase [Bacillus inaquosorum]MCY8247960.1 class A beta-lactamase [Bacillus inaquosorum]MCY8248686.1 class A beta-lactamase [Bacillus inaquosorum]